MKIHWILTCMSYFFFGAALVIQQYGIKAGLGFYGTLIPFVISIVFFVIIQFTSMQKIREKLFK